MKFLLVVGTLAMLSLAGVVVSDAELLFPESAGGSIASIGANNSVKPADATTVRLDGQNAAKTQTANLTVSGMTCFACGFMVTRILEQLPGVIDADVSTRTRIAIVSFDPQKTSVQQLIAATSKNGYPSSVMR